MRLNDVARVDFGAGSYGFDSRTRTASPIGAFAIQLLPGANALNVANAVRAKMDELAPSFPPGVTWFVPVRHHDFRQDLDQGSRQDAGRGDRSSCSS